MNWKESYADTCAELQILRLREKEVKRRVELAYKYTVIGSMPSSGPYVHISLDKGLEKIEREQHELECIREEIDRVQKMKNDMDVEIAKFTGLENMIQSRRLAGKKYKEIAMELGYSESHIRTYCYKRGYKKDTQSTNAS
jgi:predicted transcriptional regulator